MRRLKMRYDLFCDRGVERLKQTRALRSVMISYGMERFELRDLKNVKCRDVVWNNMN